MKKIGIFFTCMLVSIYTCSYCTSSSFYYSENNKASSYNLKYKRLKIPDGNNIKYSFDSVQGFKSDSTNYYFSIAFPRNDKWQVGDQDESYKINFGDGYKSCRVLNKTNDFTSEPTGSEEITFNIECPVPTNGESSQIGILYSIDGRYNKSSTSESDYEYIDSRFHNFMTYEDYINNVNRTYFIRNHELYIHKEHRGAAPTYVYNIILDWLNGEYSSGADITFDNINTYLYNKLNPNDSFYISNYIDSIKNNTKGITITEQEDSNGFYKLSLDKDYFQGYVRTHVNYNEYENDLKFYFYGEYLNAAEKANILFLDYLKDYKFKSDSDKDKEEIRAVTNYINSLSGESIIDLVTSGAVGGLALAGNELTVSSTFTLLDYSKYTLDSFSNRPLYFINLATKTGIKASMLQNSKIHSAYDQGTNSITQNYYYIVGSEDGGDVYKVVKTYPIRKVNPTDTSYISDVDVYRIKKGKTVEFDYTGLVDDTDYSKMLEFLKDLSQYMYGYSSNDIAYKDTNDKWNIITNHNELIPVGDSKVLDTNIGKVTISKTDGKILLTIEFTTDNIEVTIDTASIDSDMEMLAMNKEPLMMEKSIETEEVDEPLEVFDTEDIDNDETIEKVDDYLDNYVNEIIDKIDEDNITDNNINTDSNTYDVFTDNNTNIIIGDSDNSTDMAVTEPQKIEIVVDDTKEIDYDSPLVDDTLFNESDL